MTAWKIHKERAHDRTEEKGETEKKDLKMFSVHQNLEKYWRSTHHPFKMTKPFNFVPPSHHHIPQCVW